MKNLCIPPHSALLALLFTASTNAWIGPIRARSSPPLSSTVLTRETTSQQQHQVLQFYENHHFEQEFRELYATENHMDHDFYQEIEQEQHVIEPPLPMPLVPSPSTTSTVWEEMHHRFVMNEIVGVSNKCRIYEAQQKDALTGEPFGPIAIVKISSLHHLMRQEADIYKHVDNSELFVKIYEYHEPRTDDDISAIIMERGHIDVRNFLKRYGAFQGTGLQEICKTAADILCHLHQKDLVWTEVKSQNFVMTDEGRIKAIDFESAIQKDHANILYTAPYAPPEFALEDLCGRNMPMDFSFDIWSLGMFLYEVATGKLYFKDKFDESDRIRIFSYLKNAQELDLSALDAVDKPLLKDLISQCLKIDPTKRPTIQQVLSHPYFDDYVPFPEL